MNINRSAIYIFRHGLTFYNQQRRFCGKIDSKLTKKGLQNAKKIAQLLRGKDICVAIHTSLSRSKDTLKEVLKYHNNVYCIKNDKMIERDYGKLSGKKHNSIIRTHGLKQYKLWHRDYYTRPPEGESFEDVEKRIRLFIEDLYEIKEKYQCNIAISSHGNSIRLFRKIIEQLTVKQAEKLEIPYEKVYEYKI